MSLMNLRATLLDQRAHERLEVHLEVIVTENEFLIKFESKVLKDNFVRFREIS